MRYHSFFLNAEAMTNAVTVAPTLDIDSIGLMRLTLHLLGRLLASRYLAGLTEGGAIPFIRR
jgi:hypothetical protein